MGVDEGRAAERSDLSYGREITAETLLTENFDRSRVTELRHAVASAADAAGVRGDRLDDFVVAVNELLTNAVRHGGGSGRVVLSLDEGTLICEVSDRGAGLAAAPGHSSRPAVDEPGGRGLWLAGRLADSFELASDESGTTVRISARPS